MTDPPPPDTFLDFTLFRGVFPVAAGSVSVRTPTVFRVTIPPGLGSIDRAIYLQLQPPWPNVFSGRLANFDVPVPFP